MAIWSAEIKELEKLFGYLKGQLPGLEKELERLIRTDDENIILVYARRCLEVIVTDLCECDLKRERGTEPLKGVIDKLNKDKKIPAHIASSMYGLNELSTYGAHPKDFDPKQVKPVLVNLDIIIKWYLKYKEAGTGIKAKFTELISQEIKSTQNEKKSILIYKKKLIGLIFGLILVVAVVVTVLFITNNISGKQTIGFDKSIAVLPFDNLSNDTTQLYFSEGVVEAILDNLFKVGELKVIATSATKRYKDTELTYKEIAKELAVASILVGTVQKIRNNVRITTRLIDARSDMQLWSETYDKDLSDIFAIQSEVAQKIAKELKAKLTVEEKERINKYQTQNPEAYDLYTQGRFFWNKRTEKGLSTSIEYFEKAIVIDPNYALAIAGLADAYNVQTFWGWFPAEEGYARAKELAERAIKIDDKLAEAHATLGNILCWGEWKWEEAKKELLLAIDLNPNYATAHQYYAELLDILIQNEEARSQINIALEHDPYNLLMHLLSAQFYYHEGNINKSLEECFKLQELDPYYFLAYLWSFHNYIRQGNDLKAIETVQKIMLLDTLTAKHSKVVNEVYKNSGISGLINHLIELKHEMNAQIFNVADSTFYMAKWYASLNNKEKALEWLETGIKNRSKIPQINNDPDFNTLHSEPRYRALIKKMGLSEYAGKE